MRSLPRFATAAAALAVICAPSAVVRAAELEPAAQTIDSFDQTLLATMKQGPTLGMTGRFKKMQPAVARAFDLKAMARFAVGPSWAKFSDSDQALITDAFGRLSAASYAHNFDSYNGERFELDPAVDTRGVDKIVKTTLIPGGGAPVALNYRMRNTTGSWKAIDVFFKGTISQLTTRRSDLAAISATGDAKAIAANLNAQADKLLK